MSVSCLQGWQDISNDIFDCQIPIELIEQLCSNLIVARTVPILKIEQYYLIFKQQSLCMILRRWNRGQRDLPYHGPVDHIFDAGMPSVIVRLQVHVVVDIAYRVRILKSAKFVGFSWK